MKSNTLPKLKINLGGTPAGAIPAGARFIGMVMREGGSQGMLVLIESTGIYAQLSGDTFFWLDQSQVQEALRRIDESRDPDLNEDLKEGIEF